MDQEWIGSTTHEPTVELIRPWNHFPVGVALSLIDPAGPSVRGLPPSDTFWRTTIGRPNSRCPGLCPPIAGKAQGNGSIRECRPLVRQNKVGGDKPPTNLKGQYRGPQKCVNEIHFNGTLWASGFALQPWFGG